MKSEGPLPVERVPVVSEVSGLIAAFRADPSRIAMRLFNEASSALAYSFPIIAVGQVYQSLSGFTVINTKAMIATVVVNKLVSTVNRTILEMALLLKKPPPSERRLSR